MAALDIWMGEEIVAGTGDVAIMVIGLVVMVAFIVAEVHSNWSEKQYIDGLVRAAQGVEIAEGVTLLQGIRAYFGTDGSWSGSFWNEVDILASSPGYPKAGIRVAPTIGRVEVQTFWREGPPEGDGEPELLLGLMIEAARAQGPG